MSHSGRPAASAYRRGNNGGMSAQETRQVDVRPSPPTYRHQDGDRIGHRHHTGREEEDISDDNVEIGKELVALRNEQGKNPGGDPSDSTPRISRASDPSLACRVWKQTQRGSRKSKARINGGSDNHGIHGSCSRRAIPPSATASSCDSQHDVTPKHMYKTCDYGRDSPLHGSEWKNRQGGVLLFDAQRRKLAATLTRVGESVLDYKPYRLPKVAPMKWSSLPSLILCAVSVPARRLQADNSTAPELPVP